MVRPAGRPAAALSADEARRLALRAQGLLGGARERARGGVPALLRRLGAVQLDTISVLARSHELVVHARLGPTPRERIEAAYWSRPARAFEYWSHAACVLPLEDWPWFAFRRRHFMRSERWGRRAPAEVRRAVHERLAEEGPLTSTELGGARRGGPWWDWTPTKVAIEDLLDVGDVVCVERRGFQRVYDLAERAVPAELRAREPDDDECHAELVRRAGRCLGVATAADLADHHRLTQRAVKAALPASGLEAVEVEGWREPAWADPAALAAGPPRGRHRTTLLSPFDSLVWDRRRTARVFGFEHRLEAYVPAPRRVHGYFAMPLLAGGRLVGRVDPARDGRTLVARRVTLETPRAVEPCAAALREAAAWVGCDAVAVGEVRPRALAQAVVGAVA